MTTGGKSLEKTGMEIPGREKKKNGKAGLPKKLNLHKEQGRLQYGRGTDKVN